MTNNSSFDEHIKKQFGNYEPEVPPKIWENIIGRKEKKKPAGFWLSFLNNRNLLLLLLILTGAGTIYLFNYLKEPAEDRFPVVSKSSETPVVETKNQSVESAALKVDDNHTGKLNRNSTEELPLNAENKVPGESLNNNIQTGSQEDVNSGIEKNHTAVKPIVADKHTSGLPGSGTGLKSNTAPNELNESTTNSSASEMGRRKSQKAIFDKTRSTTDIDQKAAAEKFSSQDQNVPGENVTGNSMVDQYLNRHLLNLDISTEKRFKAGITSLQHPQLNIPCPESEKNAAGNKRYIEIYGGPDYAFRSLEDTSNSAYLEKRKATTRFAYAFSAGFRYTKVFHNGMSFRTGINYSQINEKFKFVQGNIVHQVYIVDANGDTTGSYATTATRYKTTMNKYRTLDIPLSIGYELGNGSIHANINAGVIINAYSWQKGDQLDAVGQPINITTGKTASPYQFRTNIGIGFIGAASIYHKLTDRLHLLAEPYFRYNLSPVSKAELSLKQKYNTAGLRIGMRLDF